MQRDRHTRLESFSAREGDSLDLDEVGRYPQQQRSRAGAPIKQGNLTLQIALGIWLGGTALMLTAWAFSLALPHLPMAGLTGLSAPVQQETPQHPAPRNSR